MSREQFNNDSRDFLEERTIKSSEYFKKDLSYEEYSEIPQRGLLNESFSSSNFGNTFKTSSKHELKNFRQERMIVRMSRSAANSPRLDYGRNNVSNLTNLNKILTNIETDRANATSPLIKRSNSSKSIEDLENQWDHIKKQHNFNARTSLSPNRNIPSYDPTPPNKSAAAQSELDRKNYYDVSRKVPNEKPLVSNLLSKVVPQAKINLVQSGENNTARMRATINAAPENKPKPKSQLQTIYDRYSNVHKRGQNNTDYELNTPDSRSKSPSSNVSADRISLSYRAPMADQKKEQPYSVQVHAKSKSPPAQGQRRYHSPSLNQYRNLMKQTLNENNAHSKCGTSGDVSEASDDEDIFVKVRTFTKIPPIKLRDMIPDREGINKNKPRETTPVKKMTAKPSQKNTPESNSPLHQQEINRSLEGAKISFGMPIKREDSSILPNNLKNDSNAVFSTTLPTRLKKNSPNHYYKPFSPSRDIFTKGIRTAVSIYKEDQAEVSVSQNMQPKPNQISVFSLSPIRNKLDTHIAEQIKGRLKIIEKSPLPVPDPDIKPISYDTAASSVAEKRSEILTKPTVNKPKESQIIIRKSEELKKLNKLNKNPPDKNAITDRRKMLQAEYALANYQTNLSKEISLTSTNTVKQVPGLRIHSSRREERERYTNNPNNNAELKIDSTNVSVDNSQVLNGSHRAHTNIANFMQEHVFGTNSLKSSFKANESNLPKPEATTKLQHKKEILKEVNQKPQKYYYLPRNDENVAISSKTQELQIKATVSKLIKCKNMKLVWGY